MIYNTYYDIYIYIYYIYIYVLSGLTYPLLSSQAILESGPELCKGLKQLDTKSSVQSCRVLNLFKVISIQQSGHKS